jgi:ATP-dependent DNA helicase DinG
VKRIVRRLPVRPSSGRLRDTRPAAVLPAVALAGLDGADAAASALPTGPAPDLPPLRLSADAAARIRREVERVGGREVCFLAVVGPDRVVTDPRVVARGNHEAVVAAAHDAPTGGLMIHNHPSGVLEPSHADLSVAARVSEEGLGTALVDNAATRLYVVVEPPAPRVVTPLDVDALEALIGPSGPLARLHPAYEDRPGQRRMLRMVAERYNDGGVAITEAGTGTGKSLAYLLPAAAWALQNGERTVISTATINLQEQLVGKDLPLVRDLLGGELTWALVKGRGNYISIRRARLAAEEAPALFESERDGELKALLEWIDKTEDGSLADLPFRPSDEVWEEVRSEPDVCLRAKCPQFQRCFYQRARRRAGSADLLVVNHHLLFSDLAVRRATQNWTQAAVLPPAHRLVLDEAHNVEDAATSHMGAAITRRGLFRLLARLERSGKGILPALAHELDPKDAEDLALRSRIAERVMPSLEHAVRAAHRFVDAIEDRVPLTDGEPARLGTGGIGEPADDAEVADAMAGLVATLGRLERELAELRDRIEADEARAERLEARLLDLRSVERRLAAATHAIRLVLAPGEGENESWVRWLETRGRGVRSNLALAAAPIDLGEVLRDSLFGRNEAVVLSSATLATRGRFDFLRGRLGIDAAGLALMERAPEVHEEVLPSPFDFERQTLLVVPTDLAEPDAGAESFGRLQEETARVVLEAATLTGGGLFVLFTSHRALRRVAELLRERGAEGRWPLFVHGEDDRHRLLARFTESGAGVLLGTASFWEGVDVPGDPLRGLIIQKLPFRVPTEPVTAARLEALQAEGKDPFHEYLLPLAALRLKQGFGRLIRSRTDRGAVVLLDRRFVTRRYGRYLRDSLPPAPLVKGPWDEVERALRRFYRPS